MSPSSRKPAVVVLAGPNGAGKSTVAPALLRDTLEMPHYVNADVIAQGIAGFDPLSAALEAGRIMLARMHELAAKRESFAFETTLASRSYAPWLRQLKAQGWIVHLVFLWLPSTEMAVKRVAARVLAGGHDVPELTIRRRYLMGLANFGKLYQPIASVWRIYDNSVGSLSQLIAMGGESFESVIHEQDKWNLFWKSCK